MLIEIIADRVPATAKDLLEVSIKVPVSTGHIHLSPVSPKLTYKSKVTGRNYFSRRRNRDGNQVITEEFGARLIQVIEKGYRNALMEWDCDTARTYGV